MARPHGRVPTFTKMALIRCYECGKEISSLATACPSCGAPPQSTIVPPPLPTEARPASRAKQLSWGTIALLTGVVLVLVIRGVTRQPNTPSLAASPTPAIAESATRSSPPIETASESSPSPTAAETPTAESATTSSHDEFAAYRNGLGKFTKSYRRGDSVHFRCICGDCNAASGHIPSHRYPPRRLSQCPRGSRAGLSGGYEA